MKCKIIFICLFLLCFFGCEGIKSHNYSVENNQKENSLFCANGYLYLNVQRDDGLIFPYQILISGEPTERIFEHKDGYLVMPVLCNREKKNEK